jgi:cytochrome P450
MSIVNGPDSTNILTDSITHRPFPYFDELRASEPVHWNACHRAWFVTSYNDVADGFRDQRLSSNRIKQLRERLRPEDQDTVGRTLRLLESWMVFQDAPEHKRIRSVVHKAFTPQVVASLEAEIRRLAREQVATMRARLNTEPDRPVDVLNDIAYEISGPIICKMLGVPEQDRHQFVAWTEEISSVIGGFADDPDRNEKTHAAVVALERYLSEIIETTSPSADNLMAKLVAAEADGERLSREEVIASGILILFGGNRTTSCMIANGVRALLLNRGELDKLYADRTRLASAVEEMLRWETHTKVTVRVVGEDFQWKGQELRAGQRVFLSPLAANRDASVFHDPESFDISRPNASRHLAFGTGVHLCLGMSLARLELRVFFSEILDLLNEIELVDPESTWLPSIVSRVQRQLLVRPK